MAANSALHGAGATSGTAISLTPPGGEVAGAASHDRLPQEAAALLAIDPKREWVVHFAALGVPSV